ncbi:patatin-like phospholipase family protein [Spirosoma endbachense]|uniref:PNPLA domain-containing protein n=1 Tax=Spirosoma endbachense TaxID=2666025 RepID=A0A6P1VQ38_9BACT|nr:patatin-like phospholipase family protein [Spirosoma endbachense]QHV94734.1 hypothetical protein GJR95_06780 [Spirosoma endbachense]
MNNPTIKDKNRSLRPCEILEEEYEHVHGAPPEGEQAKQYAKYQDWFGEIVLLNEDELLGELQKWLTLTEATELATTKALPNELRYIKLAKWLKTADSGVATLGREEKLNLIRTVLAEKLKQDLPTTEPWMTNDPLRPYTRGLLKYHQKKPVKSPTGKEPPQLATAGLTMKWMQGPTYSSEKQQLLNRFLLEDTFVGYVERVDDRRLAKIFRLMYESGQTALCFSGGGIRSATFGMGILQGLVKVDLLDKFTYLSTVSGGGYLGSWLSAWIHNEGFQAVNEKLRQHAESPLEPEAIPVRHLRRYSNYLSPVLGLFSADSWTLGAIYLRNLLLLWLIILPLLAAFTALPWVIASLVELNMSNAPYWITAIVALGALSTIIGTGFVHAFRPRSEAVYKKEQQVESKRDQSAFLWFCLLPLALAIICWMLGWRWFEQLNPETSYFLMGLRESLKLNGPDGLDIFAWGGWVIMGGTTVAHFLGWAGSIPFQSQERKKEKKQWWKRLLEPVVVIFTGAFAGFLLLLTAKLLHTSYVHIADGIAYTCLAVPGYTISLLLAGYVFEGLMSVMTDDGEREWTARYSAWLLILASGWLVTMGLVLHGLNLANQLAGAIGISTTAGVGLGSGILTALLGQSSKTAGKEKDANKGAPSALSRLIPYLTLPVVAIIAAISLFILLSLLDMILIRWVISWIDINQYHLLKFNAGELACVNPIVPLSVMVGLTVAGGLLGWPINTNKFSLHALYRMRLIRAYLGASRPPGERQPDPFTGFDETDNIYMGCMRPPNSYARTISEKDINRKVPFHIINIALNLVAGKNLAWQERKAESFTVSPLHGGALYLGYRRTFLEDNKGCPDPDEDDCYYGGKKGITLGTAMTISGAAASPNQGYHSSPVIGFLMTLFNVRLGWWLGNPGPAGDKTFHKSSPTLTIKPILDEMTGNTDDVNPYVYLSDGGHFENLGLYEMVLRRNRVIVVSDAGCDGTCTLEDLGNAIRKIRIDLGISIDFPLGFDIYARTFVTSEPKKYLAIGRIRYSEGPCGIPARSGTKAKRSKSNAGITNIEEDSPLTFAETDGILLYIKPAFYGQEPRDIFNYASVQKAFPHESTGDQFFSESQFESYRALGMYVMECIKTDLKKDFNLSPVDFFNKAKWGDCIRALNKKIKKINSPSNLAKPF